MLGDQFGPLTPCLRQMSGEGKVDCEFFEVCGRPADEDGEGRCFLHKTGGARRETFQKELAKHRATKGDKFGHIVFPGPLTEFEREPFEPNTDFRNCVFEGDVNFFAAVFAKDVTFDDCNFRGKAVFSDAVFRSSATFRQAKFSDASFFVRAKFQGARDSAVDFEKAQFSWVRFQSAQFTQDCSFAGVVFEDTCDFSKVEFQGDTSFVLATFKGKAFFGAATFGPGPGGDDAVQFGMAEFLELADFEGINVFGTAEFYSAQFRKRAFFRRARFIGKTAFTSAKFSGAATFADAKFTDESVWRAVTFEMNVKFWDVEFGANVNFGGSVFEGGASFSGVEFAGESVSFNSCAFRARTTFSYRPPGDSDDSNAARLKGLTFAGIKVDFSWVEVSPPDAISFHDADFRQCQFLRTDLRNADLVGVEWPKQKGRTRLYDEVLQPATEPDCPFEHLERLYRSLKQNFEERRDYERAGEFHIGEKEMRRLNPATPLGYRILLWAYKGAALYGERALKPIGWAGALLLACVLLYFDLGISNPGDQEYLLLDTSSFLRVLHYGLRVMAFLRPDNFQLSDSAKWVNTAQSILGPILLGLSALAIRQRLKR
jgi:uncharacterized protein YjbI with pentapeptide repeats